MVKVTGVFVLNTKGTRMKKINVLIICLVVCLGIGFADESPVAGEFLPKGYTPPIDGGSKVVKDKDKVKKEDGVVKAESAQDAINAAAEIMKNNNKNLNGDSLIVSFSTGAGLVASANAVYEVFPNNTATRISKRNAYIKAYTKAKFKLYETLNGLDNNSKTILKDAIINETDANGNKSEFKGTIDEVLENRVEGMLGGFVTHQIDEDETNKIITVSIVSFPKKTVIRKISPSMMEADSLKLGLDEIFKEIKNGVVAPVGGRVISVPHTGEKAFVGFGSDVVVESKNPQLQLINFSNSQDIAKVRSNDSLASILKADKLEMTKKITSSTKEGTKDFGDSDSGDPLAAPNEANAKRIDKFLSDFKSQKNTEAVYKVLNDSRLPPGIVNKVWNSPDKGTILAVSVWIPSLGKLASEIGKERSKPILDDDTLENLVSPKTNKALVGPDGKVKPLPSGKVKNDL